jgi:serine/threonine-protein kinase
MAVVRETSRYVGRYEVLEYLGSGAMSDVYAALHTGLRKRVALKVLRSALRDDQDAVERFLREGECAARVSHPNVVNVHDVGVEDGMPYLVMEFLSGETLDEKLTREGTLSIEMAIDLMLPIFDAVDHVHRAGVIHRDVKPSNILLARRDDGSLQPKLVDFGVATFDDRRLITGNLGPIGTPTYMSPEQARGLDPVDPRSDQYALASILFELMCGREPFPGADIDTVLYSVARGQFPRLRDTLAKAPRALDEALARATAFHPRDRFGSVREFAEALLPFASRRMREAFQESSLSESSGARISIPMPSARDSQVTLRVRPSQARVNSERAQQRSRRVVMMSAIAACALISGLAVGVTQWRGDPSAASAQAPAVEATMDVERQDLASKPAGALPRAAKHVLLHIEPAHAETSLNGRILGRGDVLLPRMNDGALHELRIAAPGHVPRVVLFRGEPAELSVALAREP